MAWCEMRPEQTRPPGTRCQGDMMQTSHVAVLAAAAFAVLSWLNVNTGARSIQSDVYARAEREIAAVLTDGDNIRIAVDGRDLILMGTVSTQAVKAEAESRAAGVWGVRAVANRIEVAETAVTVAPASSSFPLTTVPYRLVVSLTSTETILDGLVRDEPTRAALLAAAADRAGDAELRDTLEVEPDTHPQWSEATQAIVRAVIALEDVEARFADHEISVKGRAGSPDERDRALLAIRSAVPYGVILQTDITAPLSAAASQCQQRLAELLGSRPFVFLPTSAALLPSSSELLDGLALTLRACPDARIEVAGYSESPRQYGAALRISQARAEVIEEHLMARGVDGNRLSAIGYGATEAERPESAAAARVPSPQMALILRGQ